MLRTSKFCRLQRWMSFNFLWQHYLCLGRGKKGSVRVCVPLRRYLCRIDYASKQMYNKCNDEKVQLSGVPTIFTRLHVINKHVTSRHADFEVLVSIGTSSLVYVGLRQLGSLLQLLQLAYPDGLRTRTSPPQNGSHSQPLNFR